ncbi:MAG: hypothetical protein QM330_00500 [Acidobacteriota bacterium]|nr:hypothetical protein [Acidobacteriota bacterium]NLT32595.1 hypothetical protein [Acidobacteriota bacterium]
MPSPRECADRLREQAYKTLSPQLAALDDELEQVRASFAAGIGQLEQRIEALRRTELPAMAPALDGMLEESIRRRDLESENLARFTRDLTRKETQEEILTLLLDAAANCFPRVALFALRDDLLSGWSSRGFAEDAARTIGSDSFSPAACPEFGEALAGTALVEAASLPEAESLAAIRASSRGPWRLQALRVLDRPVALLIAGEENGAEARPQALSILANFTALRLENIALRLINEYREPAPAPAPAAPSVPPHRTVEEPQAGPVEQPPLQPPTPRAEEESTASSPEEAVHDFGDWGGSTLAAAQTAAEESPVAPVAPVAEDEKLHADARRFARLLVSEIKLYNETHVLEGRQNRDLYLRLKRDIDRSRDMYEKRVAPIVASRIDYFHDEIVRILGDNDSATLGSDYPGPRIES